MGTTYDDVGGMIFIIFTGTSIVGGAPPTPEEAAGWANRVELYKCNEVPQQIFISL